MSSFHEIMTNTATANASINTTATDYNDINNVEAWREVHRNLSIALIAARDAVNREKIKRRYLLHEISTNLNADGTYSEEFKKCIKKRREEYAKIISRKASTTKSQYNSEKREEDERKLFLHGNGMINRTNAASVNSTNPTLNTTKGKPSYSKKQTDTVNTKKEETNTVITNNSNNHIDNSSISIATKDADDFKTLVNQYRDLESYLPQEKKQRVKDDNSISDQSGYNILSQLQQQSNLFANNNSTNSSMNEEVRQHQEQEQAQAEFTLDQYQQLLLQQQQQQLGGNLFQPQQAAWNNQIQDVMAQLQQLQQQQQQIPQNNYPFASLTQNMNSNDALLQSLLYQQQQLQQNTNTNDAALLSFLQQQGNTSNDSLSNEATLQLLQQQHQQQLEQQLAAQQQEQMLQQQAFLFNLARQQQNPLAHFLNSAGGNVTANMLESLYNSNDSNGSSSDNKHNS